MPVSMVLATGPNYLELTIIKYKYGKYSGLHLNNIVNNC